MLALPPTQSSSFVCWHGILSWSRYELSNMLSFSALLPFMIHIYMYMIMGISLSLSLSSFELYLLHTIVLEHVQSIKYVLSFSWSMST